MILSDTNKLAIVYCGSHHTHMELCLQGRFHSKTTHEREDRKKRLIKLEVMFQDHDSSPGIFAPTKWSRDQSCVFDGFGNVEDEACVCLPLGETSLTIVEYKWLQLKVKEGHG